MSGPKELMENLRSELKALENQYYSSSPNNIPDDLYDYKLRQLNLLESQNPSLITPDSPTQKVGFYRSGNPEVDHELPMLSLKNAFNGDDLDHFFSNCGKADSNTVPQYVLEPKVDGVSISLIYENGYLIRAISRGDGDRGEDWTQRILHITDVPIRLRISNPPPHLTVRGEIYISTSDFREIQMTQDFSNPRNYVAGTLRLKDAEKVRGKKLRTCMYQILHPEQHGLSTQSEILNRIKELGFSSHFSFEVLEDRDQILSKIEEFRKTKDTLDTPIDGLVLKVNQLELLGEIGYTSKFPKWAIAYKYPSLVRESKLLEIFPTVGRTGKITYSGRIEPIDINGSIIQYATLHNANYIMDLDLRVGDYVGVYKSGEVVPRIVGYNPQHRQPEFEKWEPITHCPCCGDELVMRDNLTTQYCQNLNCPERVRAQLVHWCSRAAADIEGLSVQMVAKLNGMGILGEIKDIYLLREHREAIVGSSTLHIKEKSFGKLMEAIENSREREWWRHLNGLGIDFIGEKNAWILGRKYSGMKELMNASVEEIMAVEGFGQKGAEFLVNYLRDNRKKVEELMEFGLFLKATEEERIMDSFLRGKKIVITGKFDHPRNRLEEMLSVKYGAIVQGSVAATTDYLICGRDAGSKLDRAREKNIKIMDEEELFRRLGEEIKE